MSTTGVYALTDAAERVIDRIGAFAKKVVINGVDILEKLNKLEETVGKQQKTIEQLQKTVEELKNK